MKYLIISDIHGSTLNLKNVLKNESFDKLLLLGDILPHGPRNDLPLSYNPKEVISILNPLKDKIICVRGNCDAEVDDMVLDFPVLQEYQHLHMNDVQILMNHGHHLDDEAKVTAAKQAGANLVITGHTHVAKLTKTENILLLNPGSPGMTKRADQRSTIAIIENRTVTIYDIHSGEAILTEMIAQD